MRPHLTDAQQRKIDMLIARRNNAQARVDTIRRQIEDVAMTMRHEGASLREIGAAIGMSTTGVQKLVQRHDADQSR